MASDGKDAANLALIYSTLAAMGKNMDQKKAVSLPKQESKELHPVVHIEEVKLEEKEHLFNALIRTHRATESEISDKNDVLSNESDEILLRKEFAWEFKLAVDREVISAL